MSEGAVLTKEQAVRFGKIQSGEIEIEDPVMLHTYNKVIGETKITQPHEREMLKIWIERAKREHSSEHLEFSLGEVV